MLSETVFYDSSCKEKFHQREINNLSLILIAELLTLKSYTFAL